MLEYEALGIKPEKEPLSILLSVDIKDLAEEQTGKSMQDIAAEIFEELCHRERNFSGTTN